MRYVRAARIIIMADDDDIGPAQALSVFGTPIIGAARIACSREPKFAHIVRVLFTLYDNDQPSAGHCVPYLGQSIEHAARMIEGPAPAVLPVGTPLPEVFWRESHDLEQQRAGFVRVIVCRDDSERRGSAISAFARSARRVIDQAAVAQPLQAVVLGRTRD